MVNILISTYNGASYIKQQLESIFSQTYNDYQIYIRDDGSTDDTLNVIYQIVENSEHLDKIHIIEGDNLGFCESFCELLKYAMDGDYWAFCDQDDYWKPEKIEWAISKLELERNDLPLLYTANFSFVDSNLHHMNDYKLDLTGYDFRKSITSSMCYGFTCVINRRMRELLLKSDFKSIQSHDWYASMIAMAFGKIICDNRIVALHIIHTTNDSPTNLLQKVKRGLDLFERDSFYTMNCREFYNAYKELLDVEQTKLLERFLNYKYSLMDSVHKAFYLKRWNNSIIVELIQRCLMLIGKI